MLIFAALLSFVGLYGLSIAFDPACAIDGCGGFAFYALILGAVLLTVAIVIFVRERKKIVETGYINWKEQVIQLLMGIAALAILITVLWQANMYFFR